MTFVRLIACVLSIAGVACSPIGGDHVSEVTEPSFLELRGPYFGQAPPGLEPEIFAPGIVSTGLATRDVAMTPDGSELYYSVSLGVAFAGRRVSVLHVVTGLQ